MTRGLALAHFAWGVFLLLLAAWFATSAFRILPPMSTGTIRSNLPAVMVLILMLSPGDRSLRAGLGPVLHHLRAYGGSEVSSDSDLTSPLP